MDSRRLEKLIALNDQLAAMEAAGLPLDAAAYASHGDLARTLERINASVARSTARSEPIETAIAQDDSIPEWYRPVAIVNLASTDGETWYPRSFTSAVTEDARLIAYTSFLYPLIVCGMAFVGLVLYCIFVVPIVTSTYESLAITPGSGLLLVQFLRANLPLWTLLPLLVALVWIVWYWLRTTQKAPSVSRGMSDWLPSTSRSMHFSQYAELADTAAALESSGVQAPDARRLASEATLGPDKSKRANIRAGSMQSRSEAPSHLLPESRLPPFLRWALYQSDLASERPAILSAAAWLYRDAAERTAARGAVSAPMWLTALVGGSVTLGYALVVFAPLVQMLHALALTAVQDG